MMLIAIHVLVLALVLYRTTWWRVLGSQSWIIVLLLVVRWVSGILLTEYYTQRYGGGDMHAYLQDATRLAEIGRQEPADFIRLLSGQDAISEFANEQLNASKVWIDRGHHPWFNDSRNLVRMHALLVFLSKGSLAIHLLWVNVLSMLAFLFLLRAFFPEKVPFWSILIVLLPNAWVWTSMLMKEHVFLLGMGMVLFALIMRERQAGTNTRLLVFGSCLLMLFKSFWFLLLLPGLITWFVFGRSKKSVLMLPLVYGILFLALIGLSVAHVQPDVPDFLFGQQRNAWRLAVYSHAGSILQPIEFAPNWMSLIRHAPAALLLALSIPVPQNVELIDLFFFAENLVLPALLIGMAWKRPSTDFVFTPLHVLAWIAGVSILLISAYTMPVAGTLIRLRLPGLLLILLSLAAALYQSANEQKSPISKP